MIEVLLLHRRPPKEAMQIGIAAAMKPGSASPDVVAVEAGEAETAARDPEPLLEGDDEPPPVPAVPLTGSRTAHRQP